MMSVGAASLAPALPHFLRRPSIPFPALFLRHVAAPSPLSSWRRRGHGLPLSASRRRQRGGEDEDGWDDGWAEEAEDEEEDDDGDEAAMPCREMDQWLRNKPAGFGEGKTYDTRLEDELWEEMERSRKAQFANTNKLKNQSNNSDGRTKKQEPARKAIDVPPCGTQVRIWNLPRKKNIHRDLQRAFKGFPGLVSISPAVIGNQKTREPICKGFAFLDLASEEAANRFVQVYSRKTLCFGKVEKQIACDVINLRGTFNSSEPGVIDEPEAEPTSPKRKKDSPEHFDIPFPHEAENGSGMITKNWGPSDCVPPMQKQRKRTSSNKKAVKTHLVKASSPSLPGSVARLKMKERTVLTGVFSKYSRKVAAAES